jgi:DNA-directed RNA polymerase specialized sigma24 family protein
MKVSETNGGKWLKQIDEKLAVLITLNAVSLSASNELDNSTKVRLLSLAGFTSDEIGKMIGVRADTVRHIRSGASRKRDKVTAKGGEEDAK